MSGFVYDIPDRDQHGELRRPGTLQPYIDRNGRVLGKAVHIGALMRLHELWPNAVVRVRHDVNWHGNRRTTVYIMPGPNEPLSTASGDCACHPNDQFDRRRGIELAFRRALARVREREATNAD